MLFKVGERYLIRNRITLEGTYFEPQEVLNYQGHLILYGFTRKHLISLRRGHLEFDGRPTVFPRVNVEAGGRQALAALMMCIEQAQGDNGTGRPFGQLLISHLLPGTDFTAQAARVKLPGRVEEEPVYAISKAIAQVWRGTTFTEGWLGTTPNRDGLVYSATRQLDLYNYVYEHGRLPIWFLQDRRNAAPKPLQTPPETYKQPWALGAPEGNASEVKKEAEGEQPA